MRLDLGKLVVRATGRTLDLDALAARVKAPVKRGALPATDATWWKDHLRGARYLRRFGVVYDAGRGVQVYEFAEVEGVGIRHTRGGLLERIGSEGRWRVSGVGRGPTYATRDEAIRSWFESDEMVPFVRWYTLAEDVGTFPVVSSGGAMERFLAERIRHDYPGHRLGTV